MNALQYRSPMTLREAMQGLLFEAVLTRALEVQDALTLRAQAIASCRLCTQASPVRVPA
jgi:hypothetical protein